MPFAPQLSDGRQIEGRPLDERPAAERAEVTASACVEEAEAPRAARSRYRITVAIPWRRSRDRYVSG